MMVTVDNLCFNYSSEPVLEDLSFEVEKGDFVAILGPNGTGKTTLLKCINRILDPGKGSIVLEERNIKSYSLRNLARKIGYVDQNRTGSNSTVFDSVLLGRRPYIRWDIGRNDLEMVSKTLEKFNLESLSLRNLGELSGGELQKVYIARAMVQEPEILLMDEPTNHLDLKNQVELLKDIKDIVEDKGITVIMTMHDINMAVRYADRFILMKGNGIYAAGGSEIITEENIQEVYGTSVEIVNWKNKKLIVPV